MSIKRESQSPAVAANHHHVHPDMATVRAMLNGSGAAASSSSSSSVDRKPGLMRERVVFQDPPDEHTFRIMISTDNHLGYMELDPIRGEDSFHSFREMLEAAKANQVDFVLLGGDLFHDNKPSRSTLCKTVDILRQYTFGENPITFEITSDQAINFPTTKTVNYEDPNFNVALPIFSIHGNHDDPSGGGSYSTMDLLHSCSLVNYFGKVVRVDQIVNHPILMRKGDSKLALYGMGNVRDERLHRTFEMDGVKWEKPQSDPESWFNLAVVHQNRTRHTVTQRDYLPEKFLPPWLDMVIWGHEHECCQDPVESIDGHFFVLQPGSSVATSLSGGEAIEKKVVIMEIQQDQYRTVPIPLYTTRPFIIADVRLSDELDPLDTSPAQVEEFLTEKIHELIKKVKADPRYSNSDRPDLPLIRLRVEFTGFPRITNINRFGQKFVGKVANPEDLLLFSKQKKVSTSTKKGGAKEDDEKQVDTFLSHADRDRPPPIHELVNILIRQQKGSLNVLTETKLAEMVDSYVNKKEIDSISTGVAKAIKTMTVAMREEKTIQDQEEVTGEDVERIIRKKHTEFTAAERKNFAKKEDEHKHLAEVFGLNLAIDPPMREATLSETEAADRDAADDSDGEVMEDEKPKSRSRKTASTTSSARARASAASPKSTTTRKPRAKPAPKAKPTTTAKGRGRKKKEETDEDMEEDYEPKEEIEESDDGGTYTRGGQSYQWGVRSTKPKPVSRRKKPFVIDFDMDDPAQDGMDDGTDASVIDEDESARPSKKSRQVGATKESSEPIRMTTPAASSTTANRKRGRSALTLTSAGSGTPASAASSSSNFFSSMARKATPAPSSADFIDLSQADEFAASKGEHGAMEVDDVEELAHDWGALPSARTLGRK